MLICFSIWLSTISSLVLGIYARLMYVPNTNTRVR